jgi:hypothetical protein
LKARGLLVATVYKLFSFGDVVTRVLYAVILLLGWACIAPFWVIEFENTVRVFAGGCFVCVQAFVAPFVFLFSVTSG